MALAFKSHWHLAGRGNLQDHDRLPSCIPFMKKQVRPGLHHPGEPGLQVLVALLGGTRAEVGADDSVGAVLHAPHQIGRWLSMQGRGVGQPGDVASNLHGIGLILLEFDPFRLLRKGNQALEEMFEGLGVHSACYLLEDLPEPVGQRCLDPGDSFHDCPRTRPRWH